MKPIILALLTFSFINLTSFSIDHREKPAVEQAQSTMNDYGKIVWYNLVTPNIEESKQFYGSIFDWSFQDINLKGQKFVIIKYKSVPIGSMLELPKADASIWLASVSVGSVKDITKRYIDNGGRLLIDSFNVSGTGQQVILEGPLGEKMAYINNPASPISLIDNGPNQWIWAELWSTNADTSKAFYEKVWDIEAKASKVKDKPYWYFEKESNKVAGMITNPVESANTQWVPYINIADIANLNTKLEALNANIMLEPQSTDYGSIIIFQDPHGATLCAQNYSN
jgi:predicted enzyme related to lactoylglutathione lyase